jgi:hypothetical protein
MEDKIINYNFFHWGPFLYKTRIEDEELRKIKLLCKKDKRKDHRKNLAGLIRHEYKIDKEKLFPIISSYIESYVKAGYENYGLMFGKNITLKNCWVNFMTKYESNPLHTHGDDLSFVIFIKIPETLKKEIKQSVTSTGNKGAPGVLNFVYSLTKNTYEISMHSFTPNENDFFIFPAFLGHYVNHFQSEGERISVSGNLKINYE